MNRCFEHRAGGLTRMRDRHADTERPEKIGCDRGARRTRAIRDIRLAVLPAEQPGDERESCHRSPPRTSKSWAGTICRSDTAGHATGGRAGLSGAERLPWASRLSIWTARYAAFLTRFAEAVASRCAAIAPAIRAARSGGTALPICLATDVIDCDVANSKSSGK